MGKNWFGSKRYKIGRFEEARNLKRNHVVSNLRKDPNYEDRNVSCQYLQKTGNKRQTLTVDINLLSEELPTVFYQEQEFRRCLIC